MTEGRQHGESEWMRDFRRLVIGSQQLVDQFDVGTVLTAPETGRRYSIRLDSRRKPRLYRVTQERRRTRLGVSVKATVYTDLRTPLPGRQTTAEFAEDLPSLRAQLGDPDLPPAAERTSRLLDRADVLEGTRRLSWRRQKGGPADVIRGTGRRSAGT